MTTFTSNPAKSLLLAEIAVLLEGIQSRSIFAESIFLALREGKVKEIVKEIHEQADDNFELVSDIIGWKALVKIEKYFEL